MAEEEAEAAPAVDLSSNPNELPSDAHQKHISMLERLSKSQQDRLARKSASSDSSLESTSSFLSRFADSKRSVESQLADSPRIASDPALLRSHLDEVSSSISDLEKFVAENSYYLPSYEVRSSLRTISDLKKSLEILTSQLLPKRKFTFKNKASKKDPVVPATDVEPPKPESCFVFPSSPGFRDQRCQVLAKSFKGSEMGEFTLSGLDDCQVRLMGCPRTLFVHRLRNCKVYAGPVTGSILIDEAESCVFVLASHQIRIHNAKGCDFYLRVRSRPIIEDSSCVRFAPYCWSYEGIEDDLREANLEEETGNWANVDDFRWLRAVQSPNWSILPEEERLGTVDSSFLGGGDVDS